MYLSSKKILSELSYEVKIIKQEKKNAALTLKSGIHKSKHLKILENIGNYLNP